MRRSQARAHSRPPPMAYPLIAAMLTPPRDDQRVDVAVGVEVVDELAQGDQAVAGPGVGWCVGQRDNGHVAVDVQPKPGVARRGVAHRSSSSVLSRCRAMITRMISLVPSRIWCTRESRNSRSIGYSRI